MSDHEQRVFRTEVDSEDAAGQRSGLSYAKPELRRHGTVQGLTQAYLQGPPAGKGPPPGKGKVVGTRDLAQSAARAP